MRKSVFAVVFALAALPLAYTSPTSADGPAPDRATQQFEIRFMKMTIDHHLLGVAMAELCIEKATPPPPESDARLVQLCEQIRTEQLAEAQQLQQWLLDWYGIAYEGRIAQPGTLQRLERLEGEEFDIEISEAFIEHHSRQIEESLECLQRA